MRVYVDTYFSSFDSERAILNCNNLLEALRWGYAFTEISNGGGVGISDIKQAKEILEDEGVWEDEDALKEYIMDEFSPTEKVLTISEVDNGFILFSSDGRLPITSATEHSYEFDI